ncbi:peptidylprolyl isomerase [Candidatus Woesearchaeota archaeon]|nr:peptidylprolyl isomerase [Candidatus Woesearchaeota archaeon]
MDKIVKKGSKVKLHYTGKLDDGTVFDKSKEPLEVTMGEGKLIKGFEEALEGMKVGEEKKIRLTPDQAYGPRNEKLVQKVPRTAVPEKMEVKKGMILTLKDPQGRMILAKVVDEDKETISIDLNHPLAGKDLNFEIKIESIEGD